MDFKILDRVNSPEDVKGLNIEELNFLAKDIRELLIHKISTTGGHFGPNLGVVELTIAMHYVFNSPKDKIVYDISHQSYVHKILTGRKEAFIKEEKYKSIKGYTSQWESEHDYFTIGHTSTSVSLACGLAKARNNKGEDGNVIALIGDGSLSGGIAYEGLNNVAEMGGNLIVIVNDNDMSIAKNYGGLYKNLKLLRETKGEAQNNFFKALDLDYMYIDEGHDIMALIEGLKKVKDREKPIVVHINTVKGKGYEIAEKNRERFHYAMPFDVATGEPKMKMMPKSYPVIASEYLIEKIKKDKTIVAMTAGTPGFLGLIPIREQFPNQYIDVGIAEEHAVTMASAMAFNGGKPVAYFGSTFIQRTYDQLSHDLAINDNPALILVCGGGITGADVTHHGIFDIPMISNIPNIVYLAPTNKEELVAMMEWGIEQKGHPVCIKLSPGQVVESGKEYKADFSELDKFEMTKKGDTVAIIGLGAFYTLGEKVLKELKEKLGIEGTLINPRFISGVDKEMLETLQKDHKVVITLEDGILEGGFGEKVSRFYSDKEMKVLNFGATKEFTDGVPVPELYEKYHLREDLIVDDIEKTIG